MATARLIGQRSLCDRDKVGAVIVDGDNRIVDTGYNGPPAGWSRVDPAMPTDLGCMQWCPRAVPFADEVIPLHGSRRDPHYDDCPALHAEANALMFSDRIRRVGGTIYVSSGTCGGCAKLVANSGLVRAVYGGLGGKVHRDSERWYGFLRDCGLRVDVL